MRLCKAWIKLGIRRNSLGGFSAVGLRYSARTRRDLSLLWVVNLQKKSIFALQLQCRVDTFSLSSGAVFVLFPTFRECAFWLAKSWGSCSFEVAYASFLCRTTRSASCSSTVVYFSIFNLFGTLL